MKLTDDNHCVVDSAISWTRTVVKDSSLVAHEERRSVNGNDDRTILRHDVLEKNFITTKAVRVDLSWEFWCDETWKRRSAGRCLLSSVRIAGTQWHPRGENCV